VFFWLIGFSSRSTVVDYMWELWSVFLIGKCAPCLFFPECIKRPMKTSFQFMCDVCVATTKTNAIASSSKLPNSIN